MTLETHWKLGALAAFAASCAEPLDLSLDRFGATRGRLTVDARVWGGERRLEASDAAELDQLGYSVSLASNRALVGAYGETSYRGAAYVFVRSGSSWTPEQKLVAAEGADNDQFGWSVSLAADRALVGAPGSEKSRGAAYVFVRSGNSWTPEQRFVVSDGAEGDQFGWSVSLAADRALVGALARDSSRGAVYVFVRSGNSWTPEQNLVASDGATDDLLGYSVSLAADRALVGAPGSDALRGAAYVFVRAGSSWVEEQKLVASDGAMGDRFGVSASLAGDRALLGGYWDDVSRGAAYVYVRSDSSWTEEQKLVASDGADGHRFGNSTSLGADRALIGAYGHGYGRGAAYVFVRTGSSWSPEKTLVANDGAEGDLFGWSVSLADDRALVGAHYDDNLRGAAYVFSLGLPNGDPCAADASCASGYCVDDRCCNVDCAGACDACSVAEGADDEGTCKVLPAGSEGSPACGKLVCNGQSPECAPCESDEDCPEARHCTADQTCQPSREHGEACDDRAGADCLLDGCRSCRSGFCADGVCCDAACDDRCEACTAELKGDGDDGECGPIAAGSDPQDECTDDGPATCETTGLCDGAGDCQRYTSRTDCGASRGALGVPCTSGEECSSGHCASGVCCDAICDGPCEACTADVRGRGLDGICDSVCSPGTRCTSDGECVSAPEANASEDGSGCACRAGGSSRHSLGLWISVALGLLLGKRIRRRVPDPKVVPAR